ncbi:hypothetical protein ACUOBA_35290, partial [Escherichia coli]
GETCWYPYLTDICSISDLLREYIDTPLVSLKNKEIIKWFIRNNVKVNINDIEEQDIRTEILAYLAQRENKELKTVINPNIKHAASKKRL